MQTLNKMFFCKYDQSVKYLIGEKTIYLEEMQIRPMNHASTCGTNTLK